ncbi:MAG TPA: hypothetical protein DEP84_08880 [Chloroflexi bacterium]|nr:hypothetical protein [Chloroflexota bacterium]
MVLTITVIALVLYGLAFTLATPAPVQAATEVIPVRDRADPAMRIVTRIISPQIQSTLDLTANLRHIEVKGHIVCDRGEMVRIRVVVTQDSTRAVAQGHTQDFCIAEDADDVQFWTVNAVARGPAGFEPGRAEVCAWANTRFRSEITDRFQWCKEVTLVNPE